MKNIKSALIIALVCVNALAAADTFFGATFLNFNDAKKKWGQKSFDPEKFKALSENTKGAMATDALKKKYYVGENMLTVRKKMGTPDSYFFSDTIYAYKITEPDEGKESWHLIFIPDENLEKVKEVKIHKKCCYKSPL